MIVLLFLLLALAPAGFSGTPVWIDTDPSVQAGGHEVDDGFALIQAFNSPELTIRGVSVCYGNASLETAYPIAKEIVSRFGPKGLKVYKGAAAATDVTHDTEASKALASALKKEPLTILVLGPVTNIAAVINNHPDLKGRIKQIVAVAGRRIDQHFIAGPKQQVPFRDLNFELDPTGFHILLGSGIPIVLAPWEISSKVWITGDDLDKLKKTGAAGEYLYKPASDWLHMWKENFGAQGFNPFDTLAVAYLTTPNLLKCDSISAQVQILPDDTKPKGEKAYLLVDGDLPGSKKVTYCHTPEPGFKADLLKRLSE